MIKIEALVRRQPMVYHRLAVKGHGHVFFEETIDIPLAIFQAKEVSFCFRNLQLRTDETLNLFLKVGLPGMSIKILFRAENRLGGRFVHFSYKKLVFVTSGFRFQNY